MSPVIWDYLPPDTCEPQPVSWYSTYLPHRDGRLSWPRLLTPLSQLDADSTVNSLKWNSQSTNLLGVVRKLLFGVLTKVYFGLLNQRCPDTSTTHKIQRNTQYTCTCISVVLQRSSNYSLLRDNAPRYHQLIPISCQFQDCRVLWSWVYSCKQRYSKYLACTLRPKMPTPHCKVKFWAVAIVGHIVTNVYAKCNMQFLCIWEVLNTICCILTKPDNNNKLQKNNTRLFQTSFKDPLLSVSLFRPHSTHPQCALILCWDPGPWCYIDPLLSVSLSRPHSTQPQCALILCWDPGPWCYIDPLLSVSLSRPHSTHLQCALILCWDPGPWCYIDPLLSVSLSRPHSTHPQCALILCWDSGPWCYIDPLLSVSQSRPHSTHPQCALILFWDQAWTLVLYRPTTFSQSIPPS